MATEVVWSERSSLNLQNIYNYIAKDSEFYAFRFVQKLTLATEGQLSIFPLSGRKVPEFEDTSLNFLREIIFRNYRIIYNPINSPIKVTILAVVNCSMNLPEYFEAEWIIE
ncbi:MAG: type II toxin-antitoxin system RelE/ParE family toxin [Bacteroidia bacterium]|nr:type II toxin-antitoxin system RelE/ParE family toxin [Bacteroidia bacterium]